MCFAWDCRAYEDWNGAEYGKVDCFVGDKNGVDVYGRSRPHNALHAGQSPQPLGCSTLFSDVIGRLMVLSSEQLPFMSHFIVQVQV